MDEILFKWYTIYISLTMNIVKISAFAPLPIRIMAGIAFIVHGLPKFENLPGTQGFFGSVGIPPELALLKGILGDNRRHHINFRRLYKNSINSFYYRDGGVCSNC